jgi:hypothetical protein
MSPANRARGFHIRAEKRHDATDASQTKTQKYMVSKSGLEAQADRHQEHTCNMIEYTPTPFNVNARVAILIYISHT